MKNNIKKIDWDEIDTVLLDMDGTLIDLHHEDVFWSEMVPKAYAKKHGMELPDAKKVVFHEYEKKSPRSLMWGDVSRWEKELGLPVRSMRRRIKPLVKLHPHTLRFLRFLKKRNKRVHLVTAADPKDIDIEMAHTKIGEYFDGIYTIIDLGVTKHYPLFWKRLQSKINFDKNRTLLAEDNESILRAAKKFGIKYVVFKSKSSSRKPPRVPKGLFCVHHFDDLLPGKTGQ